MAEPLTYTVGEAGRKLGVSRGVAYAEDAPPAEPGGSPPTATRSPAGSEPGPEPGRPATDDDIPF
jgi:hypothetical protein